MKRKMYVVMLIATVLLSGCTNAPTQTMSETNIQNTAVLQTTQAQKDLFAMDTYMSLTAYGENAQAAVDAAEEEIQRLDQLLSTGSDESEIGLINVAGNGDLSEDTSYLVAESLRLWDMTGGCFDIAIYPVMEAWGFTTKEFRVPSEDELTELLKLTDVSMLAYDAATDSISYGQEGMKIDLGGIAKGYTSSRVMEIFREYGIESGMINLGGNVQVLGAKTDGSAWKVAIQSPEAQEEYLGVLETENQAVITSGGYERYFEQDGRSYHHIIDPATGYPAESGLVSVTIVSENGTLADGLSTSLFIMGEEKAASFWREHSDEFNVIMESEEHKLYVSEGLAECFSTDMEMEIISANGK